MSTSPQSNTVDSLPKQFVQAMRTLFEIMDDKRTGMVNFADIENRWQDDGTKGLPKGVIESLQKVTPPNGLLSFERFCAGLKICLLRNQVDHRGQNPLQRASDVGSNPRNRPPSAPLLDLDCAPKPSWTNTAAIRPSVISTQRTLSMPQLLTDPKGNGPSDNGPAPMSKPPLYGPPKPPRTAAGLERGMVSNERNIDRAEIRTALQNWQMGLIMSDQDAKGAMDKRPGPPQGGYPGPGQMVRSGRSLGDGLPSPQIDMQSAQGQGSGGGIYQKKANVRRREPRRHTLQNGIDYNMLKRMKQIEQEKDILMQGLSSIEKAREWYSKQIAAVQDKMKYLGRMGSHTEQWSETHQERLELQRARVLEVNRHLAALTDSWERGGLPLHMNLAVQYHNPHNPPHDLSTRLKRQNHLLTEEVSKKSERITMLEREKASLIRELLQIRATSNRNSTEEAVF